MHCSQLYETDGREGGVSELDRQTEEEQERRTGAPPSSKQEKGEKSRLSALLIVLLLQRIHLQPVNVETRRPHA